MCYAQSVIDVTISLEDIALYDSILRSPGECNWTSLRQRRIIMLPTKDELKRLRYEQMCKESPKRAKCANIILERIEEQMLFFVSTECSYNVITISIRVEKDILPDFQAYSILEIVNSKLLLLGYERLEVFRGDVYTKKDEDKDVYYLRLKIYFQ